MNLCLFFYFQKAGDGIGKNEMIMMKSLVWEVKVEAFEDFTEDEGEAGAEGEAVEEETREVCYRKIGLAHKHIKMKSFPS